MSEISNGISALCDQVHVLEEENARLQDELDDALQAPWPLWADSILKTLKHYGYDPVDTDGTVDLGDAFSEYMLGVDQEDEFQRKQLEKLSVSHEALTAEVERLREALERLEAASEQLAATRTIAIYTAMIDGGQTNELLELDNARRAARAALQGEKL